MPIASPPQKSNISKEEYCNNIKISSQLFPFYNPNSLLQFPPKAHSLQHQQQDSYPNFISSLGCPYATLNVNPQSASKPA